MVHAIADTDLLQKACVISQILQYSLQSGVVVLRVSPVDRAMPVALRLHFDALQFWLYYFLFYAGSLRYFHVRCTFPVIAGVSLQIASVSSLSHSLWIATAPVSRLAQSVVQQALAMVL